MRAVAAATNVVLDESALRASLSVTASLNQDLESYTSLDGASLTASQRQSTRLRIISANMLASGDIADDVFALGTGARTTSSFLVKYQLLYNPPPPSPPPPPPLPPPPPPVPPAVSSSRSPDDLGGGFKTTHISIFASFGTVSVLGLAAVLVARLRKRARRRAALEATAEEEGPSRAPQTRTAFRAADDDGSDAGGGGRPASSRGGKPGNLPKLVWDAERREWVQKSPSQEVERARLLTAGGESSTDERTAAEQLRAMMARERADAAAGGPPTASAAPDDSAADVHPRAPAMPESPAPVAESAPQVSSAAPLTFGGGAGMTVKELKTELRARSSRYDDCVARRTSYVSACSPRCRTATAARSRQSTCHERRGRARPTLRRWDRTARIERASDCDAAGM